MRNMHLVVFILVALPVASAKSVRKDFSVDSKKIDSRPRVNKYIMNIYKRVKRNDDGTMDVRVGNQTLRVDEIFGYQPIRKGVPPLGFGIPFVTFFFFNMSDLARSDTVVAAELVLKARGEFPGQPVNVTLLLALERLQHRFYSVGRPVVFHRRPNTRLSFDVKEAVEHWRSSQLPYLTLLVMVRKVGKRRHLSRYNRRVFRNGPKNGPFLVVYVNRSRENETSPALLNLLKKQIVLLPRTLPVTEDTKFVSRKLSPYRAKGGLRAGSALISFCRKSSLSVVLPRLFSWVISPSTPITIGQCDGLCYPPGSSSPMPSNHDILISTLSKKRGMQEPNRSHCVPLELTGMTVIFLDEETHAIKVQVWDKMVVKKCGCR